MEKDIVILRPYLSLLTLPRLTFKHLLSHYTHKFVLISLLGSNYLDHSILFPTGKYTAEIWVFKY